MPPGSKYKQCTYFAKGVCKKGNNCDFAHGHVMPKAVAQRNGVGDKHQRPPAPPARMTVNVDSIDFPSVEAVIARASDGLLFPTNAQPFRTVRGILRNYEDDGYRVSSPDKAQRLIIALFSSNAHNDGWTFEDRQTLILDVTKLTTNVPVRIAEVVTFPAVVGTPKLNELSFLKAHMGLIGWMTSEAVLKSTAVTSINTLYGMVHTNLDCVLKTILDGIKECAKKGSYRSPVAARRYGVGLAVNDGVVKIVTGIQVFKPLSAFLIERPQEVKKAIHRQMQKDLKLLDDLMAQAIPLQPQVEHKTVVGPSLGLLAAVEREYDGPGALSHNGPRHSNDHVDIADVQVAPTADEIIAPRDAYLPVNIIGAQHHLPAHSMSKLLDTQFRLLRADSFRGLEAGIKSALSDITSDDFYNSQLGQRLRDRGGWYIDHSMERDSTRLPILCNVAITGLSLDVRQGLVVQLAADSPRGVGARRFWDTGKRLPKGGLVAIITIRKGGEADVALATLTMFADKLQNVKRDGIPGVSFGVHFIEDEKGLQAAQTFQQGNTRDFVARFLLESPVLYASVLPFLDALKSISPLEVPISEYLVGHQLDKMKIELPLYTQAPRFNWDLSVLLRPDAEIDNCSFNPRNEVSTANAREQLRKHSRLDPSQAEAVIDSLTRELALIQGPPGTGKTFTGVELLRVIFRNKVGPVLLLAFTNHALDQLLRAIHDKGVTKNIVRLGSRSKDEVVATYNLEAIENARGRTPLHGAAGGRFRDLKQLEDEIEPIIKTLSSKSINSAGLHSFLQVAYPEFSAAILNPPEYVKEWYRSGQDGGWMRAGKKKKGLKSGPYTFYDFWKEGQDLAHLTALHTVKPESKPQPKQYGKPTGKNRFTALESEALDGEEAVLVGPPVDSVDNDSNDDEQEYVIPEGFDKRGNFLFKAAAWDEESISSDSESSLSLSDSESNTFTDSVPPPPPITLAEAVQEKTAFLAYFGFALLPTIPRTKRDVNELLDDFDIWSFSTEERHEVSALLEELAKRFLDDNAIATFESLERRHRDARIKHEEARNAIRVSLLDKIDLVGATTNGATKLGTVMKGFSPKVIVIEEAGQVLEAHVLATLFPSVQHVICIGDPLQLRPNINTYEFSVDHPRGRDLFKLDESLMEHLSKGGLPMSQLQVQRRMAPPISALIRNTLYPKLEDNKLVTRYPRVAGLAKNLFFLDHNHRERSGGDGSSSKSNDYEVAMACDLALYLLKQGVYTKEGDIVILCAYLGQLMAVKERLKGKVAVIIDERDQHRLEAEGFNDEDTGSNDGTGAVVTQVQVGRHITVRSVDNFQGEEAKVVILSTVRNAGSAEDLGGYNATIGFLKSRNRTNVAISRAQHGMYILGNAEQLAAGSTMWQSIINDLSEQDAIGPGFPVSWCRHENVTIIDKPGMLDLVAPDGGCLMPCDGTLSGCGHKCGRKCHSDDSNHMFAKCHEPCARLHDGCGHVCTRMCADDCGVYFVECSDVVLPCGHKANITCHQKRDLGMVYCNEMVVKQLPTCEHSVLVPCGNNDLSNIQRQKPCGVKQDCCSKTCTGRCGDCQNARAGGTTSIADNYVADAPSTKLERTNHIAHNCDRLVEPCKHSCEKPCGTDHKDHMANCTSKCLRVCSHGACDKVCSVACAPCPAKCTWECPHKAGSCNLPCGMPCDRVPCDVPCDKTLACSHPCPSVCGELCDVQVCPICATDKQLDQVVEAVMQDTMRSVLAEDPACRFITLDCGHIFTVETLDGTLLLSDMYEQDPARGVWLSLKTPKGYQPPKACPTCRGPITSPRYNRQTKRALLDIQEQMAVRRYGSDIQNIGNEIAQLELSDAKAKAAAKTALDKVTPDYSPPLVPKRMFHLEILNENDTTCIPGDIFTLDSYTKPGKGKGKDKCRGTRNGNMFCIEGAVATAWHKIVGKHLTLYQRLTTIINSKRNPHTVAYEAAVSLVYRRELAIAAKSTVSANRDPHEVAMRTARRHVGAPQPSGQIQFQLEALFMTIQLRLQMVPVAVAMSDLLWNAVGVMDKQRNNKNNGGRKKDMQSSRAVGQRFQALGWGLLKSAECDARLAAQLAIKNGLPRFQLRAELARLKVNVHITRDQALGELRGCPEARKVELKAELAEASANECHGARVLMENFMGTVKAEHAHLVEWVDKEIVPKVAELLEEWSQVTGWIKGPRYEPFTLKEKQEVVQAMSEWGVAGRFYQCPNGHAYVIGNCGQAMMESACAECGARIGGGHHSLRSDNRRDLELEGLARSQGMQRNPHAVAAGFDG